MTIDSQLESKATKLTLPDDQNQQISGNLEKLNEYLDGNESYKVAKLWKTTPIGGETGQINVFDTMALVHTAISERDLAETFYDQLKDISTSEIVNKAVKVNIEDMPFNVVPTKFAQQGTIGLADEGVFLDFAEIVGTGETFAKASKLLQYWQHKQGLDLETQSLLPYEIELTLAHLIHEYEPEGLYELLELFFKFGKAKRFATQINIFDKHDNILLYHNFMIPQKQQFLEALFASHDKFVGDNPDLSIFGI